MGLWRILEGSRAFALRTVSAHFETTCKRSRTVLESLFLTLSFFLSFSPPLSLTYFTPDFSQTREEQPTTTTTRLVRQHFARATRPCVSSSKPSLFGRPTLLTLLLHTRLLLRRFCPLYIYLSLSFTLCLSYSRVQLSILRICEREVLSVSMHYSFDAYGSSARTLSLSHTLYFHELRKDNGIFINALPSSNSLSSSCS